VHSSSRPISLPVLDRQQLTWQSAGQPDRDRCGRARRRANGAELTGPGAGKHPAAPFTFTAAQGAEQPANNPAQATRSALIRRRAN